MLKDRKVIFIIILAFALLMGACGVVSSDMAKDGGEGNPEYDIITLLPKDAIPSIDSPEFYSVTEADKEYVPDELVIGVDFDGDVRAYSIDLLSRREIVNDIVNRKPIAVTW